MAAIQITRISTPVASIFVIGITAALLIGATGGYLARALTSHLSAPAQVVQTRAAQAGEQVPDWVQNYMAPGQATRFNVDQFIGGLSYAPSVEAEDLPAWVQGYTTPINAPQFKVDQFIESMNYAESLNYAVPALLDRNAERISRSGGPGGQIGDAP
jgi:hypothetical protein